MENNIYSNEELDAYLKGQLAAAQASELEKLIPTDKNLQFQMNQQKLHINALEVLLEDDLRKKMKGWEFETEASGLKKSTLKFSIYLALAVAVLAALFFILKEKTTAITIPSKNSIAADTVKTLPTTPGNKIVPPSQTEKLKQAQKPSKKDIVQNVEMAKEMPTVQSDIIENSKKDLMAMVSDLNTATLKGDNAPNNLEDSVLHANYKRIVNHNLGEAIKNLRNVGTTNAQWNVEMAKEMPTVQSDIIENSKKDLMAMVSDLNTATLKGDNTPNNLEDSVLHANYKRIVNHNLGEAIKNLRNVGTTNAQWELAISFYLNGQFSEASPIFEKLSKQTGFIEQETCAYYVALCILAQGNKQTAKEQLTTIAKDTEHPYSEKAQDLLQKLK